MKKIYFGVISIFIGICLSALIGETLLRICYRDRIVLFPRYHTAAKYGDYTIRRTMPNVRFEHRSIDGVFKFNTNNRGFRNDKDIDYYKSKNVIMCRGNMRFLFRT